MIRILDQRQTLNWLKTKQKKSTKVARLESIGVNATDENPSINQIQRKRKTGGKEELRKREESEGKIKFEI